MDRLSYNDAQIQSKSLVKKIHQLAEFKTIISKPIRAMDKDVFYFMVEIPYNPIPRKHKDGSFH